MKKWNKNIDIPTLNDEFEDFQKLVVIYTEITDITNILNPEAVDFYFKFKTCEYLRQNSIAFLGAISTMLKSNGYKVFYSMQTVKPKVLKMLIDDGFLQSNFDTLNKSGIPKKASAEAVRFAQFKGDLNSDVALSDSIVEYINTDWLKSEWIEFSEKLKGDISAKMYELFANALEHSRSELGCFCCGQSYDDESEVGFTLIDLGTGIASGVQEFLNNQDISAKDALAWAFQSGNTTRPNQSGGLGLSLISGFLRVNNGSMDVYCNEVHLKLDGASDTFAKLETSRDFSGTIINIRLKKDGSHYAYANE